MVLCTAFQTAMKRGTAFSSFSIYGSKPFLVLLVVIVTIETHFLSLSFLVKL